jgi:hypothetical protein
MGIAVHDPGEFDILSAALGGWSLRHDRGLSFSGHSRVVRLNQLEDEKHARGDCHERDDEAAHRVRRRGGSGSCHC